MTGSLKIHKTNARTRQCEAVIRLDDGGLAVYDTLPPVGWEYSDKMLWTEDGNPITPHIIVQPDKYDRVETEDSTWNTHSPQALRERAKSRDDVNEDDIPEEI